MKTHFRWLLSLATLSVSTIGFSQTQLIARVKDGENPRLIARTYNIKVLDTTAPAPFVLFFIPKKLNADTIRASMDVDPRLLWVEDDVDVTSPENEKSGKGSSIAAVGDRNALYTLNTTALKQVKYVTINPQLQKRRVRIAILDNGLAKAHQRLWDKVVAFANFVPDGLTAYDAPNGTDSNANGNFDEAVGHGTMVTGIVDQMAPTADLIIARVADSDGLSSTWTLLKGMAFAVMHGAEVCNISLGSIDSIAGISDVLDWCETYGMVVVAPIGNDSKNMSRFPAKYSKVICVAGLQPKDIKAPFSNWNKKASLSAPATGILSTWWDGTLGVWSGTSFASPMVAGAIVDSLTRSLKKSPKVIRDAMKVSGDDIDIKNLLYQKMIGLRLNFVKLNKAIGN